MYQVDPKSELLPSPRFLPGLEAGNSFWRVRRFFVHLLGFAMFSHFETRPIMSNLYAHQSIIFKYGARARGGILAMESSDRLRAAGAFDRSIECFRTPTCIYARCMHMGVAVHACSASPSWSKILCMKVEF